DALSRALAGPPAERAPVGLAAAFAALPLLRFESLWLVALGVALALARRRHALALALAVAALAPVAAFAAWSMSHGWWAVPFPILAKTIFLADPGAPSAVDVVKMLAWYPLKRLAVNAPALLLLLAAAVVALAAAWRRAGGSPGAAWRRWRDGAPVDAGTLALAIAALGIWAHATFGSFGWGGRYEVYLFALAGAFLPPALARARWPAARVSVASAAIAILASTTAAALTHRAYVMHADLRISTAVVWQRDFWPARYVARHHAGAGIVAMNIGALTWLSEPRLTDVLALGDLETARLLASRRLTADAVRGLATRRDARVAILFDGYFRQWTGGAPPFTKIATARPLAAAEMAVAIYAVRAADGAAIAATLAAFAREAPGGVALEWEPAFAPR
ncbi:MAG: hypothetical protein JNL07_03820, partial [Rhodospirillales bacterium]|nr:hypothetical protein [Rhodospirillales bacterium]